MASKGPCKQCNLNTIFVGTQCWGCFFPKKPCVSCNKEISANLSDTMCSDCSNPEKSCEKCNKKSRSLDRGQCHDCRNPRAICQGCYNNYYSHNYVNGKCTDCADTRCEGCEKTFKKKQIELGKCDECRKIPYKECKEKNSATPAKVILTSQKDFDDLVNDKISREIYNIRMTPPGEGRFGNNLTLLERLKKEDFEYINKNANNQCNYENRSPSYSYYKYTWKQFIREILSADLPNYGGCGGGGGSANNNNNSTINATASATTASATTTTPVPKVGGSDNTLQHNNTQIVIVLDDKSTSIIRVFRGVPLRESDPIIIGKKYIFIEFGNQFHEGEYTNLITETEKFLIGGKYFNRTDVDKYIKYGRAYELIMGDPGCNINQIKTGNNSEIITIMRSFSQPNTFNGTFLTQAHKIIKGRKYFFIDKHVGFIQGKYTHTESGYDQESSGRNSGSIEYMHFVGDNKYKMREDSGHHSVTDCIRLSQAFAENDPTASVPTSSALVMTTASAPTASAPTASAHTASAHTASAHTASALVMTTASAPTISPPITSAIPTNKVCCDNLEILKKIHRSAIILSEQGAIDRAKACFMLAFEGYEKALGPEHPETLDVLNSIGILVHNQDDLEGANAIYRIVLKGREKALGRDHPTTLDTVNNLGFVLYEQDFLDEAKVLYLRALEGREKTLGHDHLQTLVTVNNLGCLLYYEGDLEGGKLLYQRALEGRKKALGSKHPYTLITENNLAELIKDQESLIANLESRI